MPILHAAYLLVAIVLVALLCERGRIIACVALGLVALIYGYASGQSISLIGKAFGAGFGEFIDAPGLVIVAAALISALAANAGSGAGTGKRANGLAAIAGLIAGLAGSASMGFAILAPLRDKIAGAGRNGRMAALILGLALSASHGLLLPSPLAIGTSAILGADWRPMLGFGIPVALVSILAGGLYARLTGKCLPAEEPTANPTGGQTPPMVMAGLILAVLIPLAMLILRSVGDYPDEPLGGGPARELILGIGRAPILAVTGLVLMSLFAWNRVSRFWSQTGLAGRTLGTAAPLLLTIGAAGGLQRLLQETGMSEILAGRLLDWHAGLLVPFFVAALIKALQGSSLVAMLTAAGMMQPLLGPLGLDSEIGRAIAALAVGAGATALRHIADPLFWQINDAAGLRPGHGLLMVTGGTIIQALASLIMLYILSAVFG